MTLFAVTRAAGSGWIEGKSAFDQPGAADHAAYMGKLAEAGLVLLAGPLAGSEKGRINVLLIVDAPTESAIHRCLADDPWATSRCLETTTVESWNVLVGAERLDSRLS